MIDVLSSLELIESDNICLHEEHELTRLEQTCTAIAGDGVLRHPPLAMRMSDGRYLIMDGAHRTHALQKLGCKRIAVQVVKREEISLGSWDHVVPQEEWFHRLQKEPLIRWLTEREGSAPLAEVVTDTDTYYLYENEAHAELTDRIAAWHCIVNAYRKEYAVQRIASGKEQPIQQGMVRFRYPAYTLDDLEAVVLSGQVMPAGVTRVAVDGRLLNLNIPLAFLTSQSFDQADWDRQKVQWTRSLRLYAEAVYLCEV